jgi:tetratricopeptide (TPR) repeat protein
VDPARPLHWAPLVALVIVVIAIVLSRRRGAIALLVIGLLLLAPTIGLANSSFFRLSYVADHWTYPALMVFAIGVAWVIERATLALSHSGTEVPLPDRPWHFSATVVVLILVLASLTWRRSRAYHDTLSLWQDAASKVQNNYAIYNNLAWAYLDAGRANEALTAAERAAQLAPDEPEVQQTLSAARLRVASQPSAH